MRIRSWCLLLLVLLPLPLALAADPVPPDAPLPIALEFGGYQFGKAPAANMVCFSGFCKSQAPGGDGRISFPFSMYETPGAVSTLAGMTVTNARYTFWEDRLYRVFFQVDCAPLEPGECLDDVVRGLHREYGLTPLSTSDNERFVTATRSIMQDFLTDSGAYVRVRSAKNSEGWLMPSVDIVDKGVADRVGSTLSPTFKPKKLPLPTENGKP